MGTIASQITSLMIVYSIFYWDTDQRKHQSSASLAFVQGIHRSPVNSPHKGQWRGALMFSLTQMASYAENVSIWWRHQDWTTAYTENQELDNRRYIWTQWIHGCSHSACINTLRPRQNGCYFPDSIFKWIFLNENVWIPIRFRISLNFVPKVPIDNGPALIQIMAWCLTGNKPWSEPVMAYFRCINVSLGFNELSNNLWGEWAAHWSQGVYGCNLNLVISKLLPRIYICSTPCKTALRWMPQDLTDDQLTWAQVMAQCHQVASH